MSVAAVVVQVAGHFDVADGVGEGFHDLVAGYPADGRGYCDPTSLNLEDSYVGASCGFADCGHGFGVAARFAPRDFGECFGG